MYKYFFKIKEKKPSIEDLFFSPVVPKLYRTVTPNRGTYRTVTSVYRANPNIYIYIYIYMYTLTGHFIRYTLLVAGWTPFCLQNCLNSSWHWFNKVLETFLRDFGPYWHDSITQLLQICRLHIHDENLPFHHIPKVLYWMEIWWLWRLFE